MAQPVDVVDAGGLISKIGQAARTAQRSKTDCENLARRVGMLADLLPRLQEQDHQEGLRLLAGLGDALSEAHDLVMSCQEKRWTYQFFTASMQAERFRDVERKIDSYLSLMPIISHINIIRSLDDNYTGVWSTSSHSHLTMELNVLERILNGTEEPSHLDLPLLQSITENFSERNRIGHGGCGDVYKGILRNGAVAVKRLFEERTIKDKMFHREVTSLIKLRHENIVRFLGYCSVTEERVATYGGQTIMADKRVRLLCFEFIRNGNLENYLADELRGLEWHTRYQIIMGICNGLLYLHKEKNIIHMDLKPANILLDDHMVPKITDFGLSRLDNNSQTATTSRLISPGYCPPEYYLEGKWSSKSDIYSLGVIITELVTGTKKKLDLTKVLRRWRHRWIKSSQLPHLGYQQVIKCLELAQRCMQIDPTTRPDILDIIHELNAIDTMDDRFLVVHGLFEDILGIHPLEIHIPFELDHEISHSIELINHTDDHISFMTKVMLRCFGTEPNKGIVPPLSKCIITITVQAQVNELPNDQYKQITILSSRVDGSLAAMDVTEDMFIDEEGKVVDEVNVMVISGKSPLAEDS